MYKQGDFSYSVESKTEWTGDQESEGLYLVLSQGRGEDLEVIQPLLASRLSCKIKYGLV